eukprot:170375-Pelagomonas_calceolata.AAC.2
MEWAKARMEHVNLYYGKMVEIGTQHQPLGLFTPIFCHDILVLQGLQITPFGAGEVRYGVLAVKTRVHAAAN